MLRAEEAPTETVDCLACHACLFVRPFAVRVDEVRDRAQRVGRIALKVGAPARRPQQHDREDRRAGRKSPAFESVQDRGVRGRDRHRQDEREDRGGRPRCEIAIDHSREQRDESDDRHRAGGQQRTS